MPQIAGFVGGAYEARSKNFDAQRCVNFYPEISESGSSKTVMMLVGTPGLKLIVDFLDGPIRGMIKFNEKTGFIISGVDVYRYDLPSTFTKLTGKVDVATTPISMATNGIDVFAVDGISGFVVNPANNTCVRYINVSFKGADRVDFIDGSYVFNEPGTGRFWVMDPYSTILDPLYFATAEGSPDGIVSLIVNQREIWIFGSTTTEVWANTGDALNFPFSRITGAAIDRGIAAKDSPAKIDMSLYWLSADERGQGMVVRSSGYSAPRISTFAVEKAIASYSRIDDAIGYTYQQQGHSFYVLTFPTADKTWVYDQTSNIWHERAWRKSSGSFGRHRSNCHIYFDRKNVVGDWENGKLYQLDLDAFTDDGAQIRRVRSCNHIASEQQRIPHNSFHVDLETGVGLTQGQGSDPKAILRWSDDGGHNWSNERIASIGKIGDTKARVRFTRLGSSRDRVYEFSVSDPVKINVFGAMLNGQ